VLKRGTTRTLQSSRHAASLPASFAFDTPPVYTTAPQQPDMLPSQQQSTLASTSSSAYGRGQRSDSLSAPLPPQAGAMPSSPDSSGPTGWPLRYHSAPSFPFPFIFFLSFFLSFE